MFKARGKGEGYITGAVYELHGWAFFDSNGNIERVNGSTLAVRGPDANPEIELGRRPINTVGSFVLVPGS